mmetsp:Transcript_2554/g.6744  ORF Transcript_2554/g.6744 Transcript_2554/m.6744 type:complete len:261 (+) Transcript_2554:157-939(+)
MSVKKRFLLCWDPEGKQPVRRRADSSPVEFKLTIEEHDDYDDVLVKALECVRLPAGSGEPWRHLSSPLQVNLPQWGDANKNAPFLEVFDGRGDSSKDAIAVIIPPLPASATPPPTLPRGEKMGEAKGSVAGLLDEGLDWYKTHRKEVGKLLRSRTASWEGPTLHSGLAACFRRLPLPILQTPSGRQQPSSAHPSSISPSHSSHDETICGAPSGSSTHGIGTRRRRRLASQSELRSQSTDKQEQREGERDERMPLLHSHPH